MYQRLKENFGTMDDDVEKPALSCAPCSEKLPLILSDPTSENVVQVPASMAQYLRDYQREGVRFLYQRYRSGGGALLADDMGLGKTIQAIGFISAILEMKGTKDDKLRHCVNYIRQDVAPNLVVPSLPPVLIICPASLSDNWVEELETWGFFKILKFNKDNRSHIVKKAKRHECDVVITTFEMARSYTDVLNLGEWSAVLVDEVHRIKEPGSQTTKALASLQCLFRFGFTGTPFQNNLKEMWCLFNWANPNCLGDLSTFTNDVIKVIELSQRHTATKRDSVNARRARTYLATQRKKYMLRRTKDVLAKHLPRKTDQIVFCDMTPFQESIYRAIVESPEVQSLLRPWARCECDSGLITSKCCQRIGNVKEKAGALFSFMHILQKTANHVALLVSPSSCNRNSSAFEVCQNALQDCEELSDLPERMWYNALSDINKCGKMQVLSQMLITLLGRGDKILLFSYSTKVLDLVQKHLVQMRYKYSRLDGSTPTEDRISIVRSFNLTPEPSVFLLSTKAGGVGLNITGANVVIIYDPNWNPAHDLQAQDRAYRLGQQRDVRVYRLLSTATIEEFVYLRQLYKQQMASVSVANENARRYFNSVPGDNRYYGELFGIRNLFSFRENSRSLTEEIIERQQKLEQTFRLNIRAPCQDETCGAQITECDLTQAHEEDIQAKSGVTQFFQEICQEIDVDPNIGFKDFDSKSDEESDDVEDETVLKDQTKILSQPIAEGEHMQEANESFSMNDTMNEILETTTAVRHVLQHNKVVGPSSAEDFMANNAVQDLLEKGTDSQRPMFDCLSAPKLAKNMSRKLPQLAKNNEGQVSKSSSNTAAAHVSATHRVIFNRIARRMSLTPFELGQKVLTMAPLEKLYLLTKYQRKKQKPIEAKRTKKTHHEIERLEFCTVKKDSSLMASKHKETAMGAEKSSHFSKRTSPKASSPFSSFDSQTITFMEELLSTPKSKKRLSPPSVSTQPSGSGINSRQTRASGAMNTSKNFTSTNSQSSLFIDSLLFSSPVRKKSKDFHNDEQRRKSNFQSSASTSQKTSSVLSGGVNEFIERVMFAEGKCAIKRDHSRALHSCFKNAYSDLRESPKQSSSQQPDSQEYSPKDDLYEKLLKTGKLVKTEKLKRL